MPSLRRVAVVITARPSLARVQTVLDHLYGSCDLQVVMAASTLLRNYGEVARSFPYPVAEYVYSTLEGDTLQTSVIETGVLTMQLAGTFARLAPDIIVTIADRHETLATATAASYMHIPLLHIQGGEKTGSIDDKVRDAVSMLADVHCAATATAARRLEDMPVRGPVFNTGCPSVDLAARAVADPADAGTVVVLQHSVTNEADYAREQIEETIAAIEEVHPPRVVWFWPGQDAGEEGIAKGLRLYHDRVGGTGDRVLFRRHMYHAGFLGLVKGCACLVGNSSAGIRESCSLGTPVVDIGTRQAGRERAPNVYHAPHVASRIAEALREQMKHGRYPSSHLYGDGRAGERIARILLNPQDADLARDLGRGPDAEGVERLSP